jgi:hypothetical protein
MFCPDCTTYKLGVRRTLFWLSAHTVLVYFIGQNAFGVFWTGERDTPLVSLNMLTRNDSTMDNLSNCQLVPKTTIC